MAQEAKRADRPEPRSFFPQFDGHPLVTEAERATIGAVEAVLLRDDAAYAQPRDGNVLRLADGTLQLRVQHQQATVVLRIELTTDGVALRWTGGLTSGPWGPKLERTLEALLQGRNVLAVQLRWGCAHTIETTTWETTGGDTHLICQHQPRGLLPRLLRGFPGPSRTEHMTISFERPEALGPPRRILRVARPGA